MTSNQPIFDAMVKFFTQDNWSFSQIKKQSALRLAFKGENGKCDCYAQVREKQKQFIFYSLCPIKVPKAKRRAVGEFLLRVNSHQIVGSFQPSSVYMSRYLGTGIKHTQNRPDSGIQTRPYLLPDNVNFFNVQIREVDVPGVGTGVYNPFNGVSHSPHPATIPLNNIVVPSKGTQVNGKDTVYSGDPMTPAPFAPGAIAFAIPYEYKVGSGSFHRFATVTQTSTLASDGSTLTSSKAGATGGTTVAAPTSTF